MNSTSAPIQFLREVSTCPNVTSVLIPACGSVLAVTVQIPYELMLMWQGHFYLNFNFAMNALATKPFLR